MRIEKTIKVMPATKQCFDQLQRELAAKLRNEVTQDELVEMLLRAMRDADIRVTAKGGNRPIMPEMQEDAVVLLSVRPQEGDRRRCVLLGI